ncbi:hypothetical protein BVC80_957g11 [Macleaya cordata]|uniref:Uncharacterized protein n=1 Tax=Macleaya cordata TaxID=56857 RepID=A0A200R0F3_MACCD|nr:hypothetical protein BVC80_957g11 [Macleaya cordata]
MGTKDKKKTKKDGKKEKKEETMSAQDNTTTTGSRNNHGNKIITDSRFSSVHSDPRFQKVPKHQSKVPIDSRFNRMFSDKNFSSSSAPVDKRGKPKNQKSENPLRHYYRLDEEEEPKKKEDVENDYDEESEEFEDVKLQKHNGTSSSSESESNSEFEELKSGDELESDDSSSTSSDTDDENEVYSEDELAEPEENIPEIEQETRRLAIVNMDWSQVRAVDLYVLMSSFLPKSGQILSIAVYPSEFGLKCMEEEAVHGPIGLFDNDKEKSDDDDDDDDEIHEEKLRAYEKSRLRYYYAVVECDSSATADHLYKNCDGTEFERTSNVLDLRFIPDSMEFKHPPRDIATEAPTNYEGLDFHTRALQQSKVNLSWDEDEPQRAKALKRKFNADQLAELELNAFLASDDGESDDDENDEVEDGQSEKKTEKREKYRALIQAGEGSEGGDDEDGKDMEVTFSTGLEDISKRILEKKKDQKSETVWEAYLRKRSEKRKARKNRSKYSSEDESSGSDQDVPEQVDDFFIEEPSGKGSKRGKSDRKEKHIQEKDKEQEASRAELELLLADDPEANNSLKGYNMKPKKAKGKKEKEIPSEDKIPVIDYEDPRFTSLFSSPLFALDPTDPQYKRSAAYARQLAQKHQHGVRGDIGNGEQVKTHKQAQFPSDDTASKKDVELHSEGTSSSKKEKHELSSLVRSIKKKAQQVQAPTTVKDSRKNTAFKPSGMLTNKEKNELSSMIQSIKKKIKR